MTTTPQPTHVIQVSERKQIVYDRITRDYAMYLDGELVGFERTYHDAEIALDVRAFDLDSVAGAAIVYGPIIEGEIVSNPPQLPAPADAVDATTHVAALDCAAQVTRLLETYRDLYARGLVGQAADIKRQALDMVGLAFSAVS